MEFLFWDIIEYINGAITCAMKDPAATLLVLMLLLLVVITPGRKNAEKVLILLIICFIYLILTSNVLARTYIYAYRRYSFKLFTGDFYEMLENILLFFPLGMLMCGLDFNTRPVHYFKERKSYHFIRFIISMAFAGVFTCVIELLQFNLRVGVFTLDDILCNTFGAALGYGIVFASIMIARKLKKSKAVAGKEQANEQQTNA
ncbi:MAG: VanZ family protein [Saccharofermentans sp.]|nr:VanZ family protein [Saccharofermentans sp.]